MQKEIERLLKEGIIRKAKCTEFASPAFPIVKKNGDIRLVVDYREINKRTIKDAFPFPNVRDELLSIPKSSIFSKLDLKQGYHQVLVEEKSRKYTAFVILNGYFEYCRVPFGLSNAPRFFQQMMSRLLGHYPFVRVFLDDILVFSDNAESHSIHLREVLEVLKNNNMTISCDKSEFFKSKMNFLGHVISSMGLQPEVSRVIAMESFEAPKTKKQLLKLLGTINWFRPFIKNLSKKITPLTNKTRKDCNFNWTDKDQMIANQLLKEIKEATLLAIPDYNKPFIIDTDASGNAVGALLYQEDQLVGIFSQKLKPAEKNYTNTERALLAIIRALEHFRSIIYGTHITVRTDHKNLLYPPELQSSRSQRWKLLLEEYDVKLVYLRGEENQAADMLSRCARIRNFSDENTQIRINIAPENAKKVLEKTHSLLGHPGRKTLKRTVSKYLKIPNICKLTAKIRRDCPKCQRFTLRPANYGELKGNLQTDNPFEHVSTDILGPIPTDYFPGKHTHKKFWVMTMVDRCTRWTCLYGIYDISPKTIIKCLEKWIETYGPPKTVLSDQGRQYMATEFKEALLAYEITHSVCSAYNPTGNGISERLNPTIIFVLKHFNHLSISAALNLAEQRLRLCYHSSLKCSPIELVTGNHPLNQTLKHPDVSVKQALTNAKKMSSKNLRIQNQRRYTHWKFKVETLFIRKVAKQESWLHIGMALIRL